MEIVWQTPANPPERHDYIFRNGKRHVRPYYFEFISHVKNRWAGKTIVDLFAEEFKGRPYDYYVSAVKSGRIQVDGQIVSVSYIVQPSQKISHFLHRHEPPVLALDVSILQREPDVLTVCKPASVPVHPCGQYCKNTVVGILQAEHGLFPLFPVHRLDRLVSGLLILARTAAKADVFRQQIESGKVHKQYIAKVIGEFPEEEEGNSFGGTALKGKVACTKFTRIGTDGTHSIVLCEPITGRTHQIRVHLQYTGHPIANDVLYLSETVADRSIEGTTADRAAVVNSDHSPASVFSCNADLEEYEENSCEGFSIDPMCTNCPNLTPKGYGGHEEGLWLHCVKYSGPGWIYECPYPSWASLS
ncbi:RNA pseudouridine synthase 7-like isoform X2 [Macadamia integrifolia]|uniref:RNA pseudouridine synthase 7-like isoform X2 n=1 Tax=Macadamia integrifolia TaxID=60698 RepID=UPI001C5316BB|nr:RNA pseudouridine synthase 7-like isoform X2 [Macadamia integrifolia]